MRVFLKHSYRADVQDDLLGYIGENNSRKITLVGFETDGADRYKIVFSYPDGVQYEADITSGEYTIPMSLLRAPVSVSMQIIAVRSADGEYIKKSNVFCGSIKSSVSGESEPIPPYEDAADALDKVLAAVERSEASAEKSEQSAQSAFTAQTAAETARNAAESAATSAAQSYEGAEKAAQNATQSAKVAEDSAVKAAMLEQVIMSAKSEIDIMAQTVEATAREVSQNAEDVATDKTAAENAKKLLLKNRRR